MDESIKIKLDRIDERMRLIYELINTFPISRQRSLAKTKLEECVMWLKKCCYPKRDFENEE